MGTLRPCVSALSHIVDMGLVPLLAKAHELKTLLNLSPDSWLRAMLFQTMADQLKADTTTPEATVGHLWADVVDVQKLLIGLDNDIVKTSLEPLMEDLRHYGNILRAAADGQGVVVTDVDSTTTTTTTML